MLLEDESHLPHDSGNLWLQEWESRFNLEFAVPEHIVKRIAREKELLKVAAASPSKPDTYHQSLARAVKAHIIFMSKEWYLAEHINLNVRQTPRVYETVVMGSGLNREDVVAIMNDRVYLEYEETVRVQTSGRDGKIANRKDSHQKEEPLY
jgi:hypothetical protein